MRVIGFLVVFLISQSSLADMVRLLDVESRKTEKGFVTALIFDRSLKGEEYSVDFINETVQINIPGAKISGQKRFQAIDKGWVKNLYTYQVDEDLLRHRIILNDKSAIQFENQVRLEAGEKKLIVYLGETKPVEKKQNVTMKSLLQKLPAKKKRPSKAKSNKQDQHEEIAELSVKATVGHKKESQVPSSRPAKKEIVQSAARVEKTSLAESKKELSESEIPVLVASEKKAQSGVSYWRIVFSFMLMGALGLGVFFLLKRYKHKGLTENKHTSIKMLTQHYIGPKKSLAIIQVAGESILVGITDQNINHIKTLSLLDEEIPQVSGHGSFADSMTRLREEPAAKASFSAKSASSAKEQVASAQSDQSQNEEEKDEFSIKGLKDLVSTRLNGMREL